MADQLDITRDPHNIPVYDIDVEDATLNYNARLAADTDTTVTVPAGVRLAFISCSDFVFVWKNAVITLPTVGAGFAAGAGFQNPQAIPVVEGDVLHLRARNATDVTVIFKA